MAENSSRPEKVVVVDDERPILMTLEALLRRHGYDVHLAANATTGLATIRKLKPDLVLLDLGLPDADGLETLATISSEFPETTVIILTAQDSLNNAIESIKLGAFHFISKPYVPEELLSLMSRAMERSRLREEAQDLRTRATQLEKRLEEAEQRLAPVFQSRKMKEIDELIQRIAPSDANILLTGESGVGKEIIANRIHRLSKRENSPFVKLNCAAFPHNMIEAELFGYKKGAFTGAVNDFPGMISEAKNGTLLLDEIGEMPVDLQTRFLRVLQEREFRPLGSTKTVKANFRLIAATNRSISEALADGSLRQDLYYRLNTFRVEIPPLRDRREDIPALATVFAKRFASRMEKTEPKITPEAFKVLMDYSWPGNVRELENAVEYATVLSDGGTITEKLLPAELQLPRELQAVNLQSVGGADLNLDNREKEAILKALAQSHGNKKKAAEILGIHRPTLYSKMKRYAIELK